MDRGTRRDMLRVAGGVGAGYAGLMAGIGIASAAITVSGRMVAYDDDPVADRMVRNYGEGSFNAYTNKNGEFSAETRSDARLGITLYKGNRSTMLVPVRNGVPHVYNLGDYYTKDGDTDLGELRVPKAYLVRLRALDSDGEPVRNANPGVRHGGSGIGSHYMSTESDGWAYINGADFDGIELAGRTLLSMEIPVDGGGAFKLEERVNIDGPKTVTFQVGEGVTVSDSDATGSESTTTEPKETSEPTTTASTTTTSQSTATPTASTSTTTTSMPTPTIETTTVSNGSGPRSTDNITDTPELNRGFFSNGDSAGNLGPLGDPITLTVGGFALSVLGIAHQMIRGY